MNRSPGAGNILCLTQWEMKCLACKTVIFPSVKTSNVVDFVAFRNCETAFSSFNLDPLWDFRSPRFKPSSSSPKELSPEARGRGRTEGLETLRLQRPLSFWKGRSLKTTRTLSTVQPSVQTGGKVVVERPEQEPIGHFGWAPEILHAEHQPSLRHFSQGLMADNDCDLTTSIFEFSWSRL